MNNGKSKILKDPKIMKLSSIKSNTIYFLLLINIDEGDQKDQNMIYKEICHIHCWKKIDFLKHQLSLI
jgi:hypothetical protein